MSKSHSWNYGSPLEKLTYKKEYDGSTTNAQPCYSDLYGYASIGSVKIIPPTPATASVSYLQPMRPYKNPFQIIHAINSQKQDPCDMYCRGGLCWNC